MELGLDFLLWLVVAWQGLLILALHRRTREAQLLMERVDVPTDGPPRIGSQAPPFDSVDAATGTRISLKNLSGGRFALLFLSASCGVCKRLSLDIRDSGPSLPGVVAVSANSGLEHLAALSGRVPYLAEDGAHMARLYGARGTPFLVLVTASGQIEAYRQPSSAKELLALELRELSLPRGNVEAMAT